MAAIPFPTQPPEIETGYELEFSSEFNLADLPEGYPVKVRTEGGFTYTRGFNRAEFKQRNLTVVGVMAAYQWKRPSPPTNQDEVIA